MSAQQLATDVKDAIEDTLERNLSPKKLKRYMELLGPALLIVTYAEDAWRIVTRWSEQMVFMSSHMRWPRPVGALILLISIATQVGGSVGVVSRRQVKHSCYALLVFTGLQPVVYGQLSDPDFMFRMLTQIGGLLLLLRHEATIARAGQRGALGEAFSGVERGVGGARLQLLGRTLLMVLFFFQGVRHVSSNGATPLALLGYLAVLLLCILVMVGFKARWSAVILAVALGVSNMWMYPFWRVSSRRRDFYKYYFFNTVSVMGGLILLATYGPGGLSVDQGNKKGI